MSTEWLVGFTDAEHWPTRRLPSGLQHCFAACFIGVDELDREACWLLVDPRHGWLNVVVVGDEVIEGYWRAAREGGGLWRVQPSTALLSPFAIGLSCVQVVKRILGVWWPLALTPAQLRRRLIEDGAIRED